MSDSSSPATALSMHHERAREPRRPAGRVLAHLRDPQAVPAHLLPHVAASAASTCPRRAACSSPSNHRSFLDPFVVGAWLGRPVFFVAKKELFDKPLDRLVPQLPRRLPDQARRVRRGVGGDRQADPRARRRARDLPRGHAHPRRARSARPKRGVGRLALETGAPVVPVAVHGTERARRGWRIRPVKVKLRYGRPLTFPRVENASRSLATEVTARIWPCVELQWEWLGGLPPLRKAAVIGAGSMGTGVATLLARAGLEVQLGCRGPEQAERIAAAGRNDRYLPQVELPDGVTAIERRRHRARGRRPRRVRRARRARCPRRWAASARASASAAPCSCCRRASCRRSARCRREYVGARVNARAVACLGGPFHSGEAVAARRLGRARLDRPRPPPPARRRARARRHRRGAHRRRGRRGARGRRQERRRAGRRRPPPPAG